MERQEIKQFEHLRQHTHFSLKFVHMFSAFTANINHYSKEFNHNLNLDIKTIRNGTELERS